MKCIDYVNCTARCYYSIPYLCDFNKKSTDVSNLSKSTSETPHNVSTTDHEMNVKQPNQATLEEVEALRSLTDINSPIKSVSKDTLSSN